MFIFSLPNWNHTTHSLYPTFLVLVIILKYTLFLTILQAHDIMSLFKLNYLWMHVNLIVHLPIVGH